METLRTLFERIEYREVSRLFDDLEQTFSALTEQINLELPENVSGNDIAVILERNADKWDEIISLKQEGGIYISQAHGIYGVINNEWQKQLQNGNNEIFYAKEIVRRWFFEMHKPESFVGLLFIHQRMRQLRQLIELFQRRIDKKKVTSRHLFERGFALLYHINGVGYLERVFNPHERYDYRKTISFLRSLERWGWSIPEKPRIDWEKDATQAAIKVDKLYEHLKYADLAYRNHTTKGFLVDALNPYMIHFAKYGGENINGRFQLQGNMNGFVGYKNDKTIIVGLSGTELISCKNWKTNICQYFGRLDPVYLQAAGLVNSVWLSKTHKNGFKQKRVIVCGHSLGGGMMQFAIGMNGKSDIEGYGYNSAGLSRPNLQDVWFYRPLYVHHLYQPVDAVFVLPFTMQLGKSVKSAGAVLGPIRAHLIGALRKYAGTHKNEVALIKQ